MRVKRRKEVSLIRSLAVLVLFCSIQGSNGFEERRCRTMDIRNNPMGRTVTKKGSRMDENEKTIKLDLNCTVLEGSFLMSMVGNDNQTWTREDFPSFEHLREITGSVLIFQVAGLRSLKWLFPNLRVIGGSNLIQHYSLIVYQNKNLTELGLDNLRVIRNGGVRLAENNRLCNAKSINWDHLQFGNVNDVLVDDSSEISAGEGSTDPCVETCIPDDLGRCLNAEKGIKCWSPNSCQLGCDHDRNSSSIGPGCSDDSWERCHSQCIAGCSRPDDPTACHACLHVSHEGRCLAKCPDHLFSFMDRRCVSKFTCEALDPRKSAGQVDSYKAFNGRCHYHCPDQHEEDPANNKTCRFCGNDCIRKCQGNITIDSLSKALTLEKCTLIDGSLEIEMRIAMDSVAASELTKAFGKIKKIDGYLLIRMTSSFVNLHMFKSLQTVTGRYLYRDKYAISVYENANLNKLFPPNPNFAVSAGFLQFQNNKNLCFVQIVNFMKSLGRFKEMDENDQSRNSNGDKAICSESSFNVTVDEVSSTSFRLKWKAFNTTDIDYRKFLGYEIKYKEVEKPDENMSIDDDRSACSDSWNSHFLEVKSSVSEGGHVHTEHKKEPSNQATESEEITQDIANEMIKPNTYYAFYVTTAMVRHEGATNAVSRIGFLRTNFGTPDPPVLKVNEERGTDTIYLQWDPPARPNGEITHYIVTYKPQTLDHSKLLDEYGDGCYEDIDGRHREIIEDPTTLSPGQQTLLSTVAPSDTCQAQGCCTCAADPKTASEQRQDATDFENHLQDTIFVQNCEVHWNPIHCDNPNTAAASSPPTTTRKRSVNWEHRREAIYRSSHPIRNTLAAEDSDPEVNRQKRSIKPPPEDKDTSDRIQDLLQKINTTEFLNEPIRKNVTGTNITLTHLHHYTDYFISIAACQNASAVESHCSQRKAWKTVKTRGIREADLVDNSTIVAEVINGTDRVKIAWEAPSLPNGRVRSYEISVINMDTGATPVKQCKGYKDGWTPREGYIFTGLADGRYRVEIRTRSLLPKMSEASYRDELFVIYVPGFWTMEMIITFSSIFFVILLTASIIAYYYMKKVYGKKVIAYATQMISANPEYLSQQDVYKADEWELSRSKLTVGECIGKGTFGQVFKGYGQQVQSVKGHIFGPCAIKTVTDGSNAAERIHFLLEASVMKKFDAHHIVKLYGVVSDGQPVYVVMELMDNGNLRDYLRSRRPDAEENVQGLAAPTEDEMLRWAIQIADGMAYLESLKFCHRDLAARNCMVSKDLVVKIGDFGMTRDLCYREYYKPAGRRMMPVRWMSPESLLDGRHDIKSDVWSYGIVLYEMWTLGQQPYQGLGNDDIIEHICRKRKIMELPDGCPDTWYTLMQECWKYNPRDRPNFFSVVDDILDMAESKQIDLQGFTETSFVIEHPDLVNAIESTYGDDDNNPYQPDPLVNFLRTSDETQSNEDFMFDSRKKRGADAKPGFGEGDALTPHDQQNGIAEHEV